MRAAGGHAGQRPGDFGDPGWYEHPDGTVAYQWAGQPIPNPPRAPERDAGRITIRHGEIKNPEMPPMTMVFRVKDASLLQTLKEGEKVRFVAERLNGAITITSCELTS